MSCVQTFLCKYRILVSLFDEDVRMSENIEVFSTFFPHRNFLFPSSSKLSSQGNSLNAMHHRLTDKIPIKIISALIQNSI